MDTGIEVNVIGYGTGVVMDPTNLDTWPTFQGHYHPGRPYKGSILVRLDRWMDDVWCNPSQVVSVARAS